MHSGHYRNIGLFFVVILFLLLKSLWIVFQIQFCYRQNYSKSLTVALDIPAPKAKEFILDNSFTYFSFQEGKTRESVFHTHAHRVNRRYGLIFANFHNCHVSRGNLIANKKKFIMTIEKEFGIYPFTLSYTLYPKPKMIY